MLKYKQIWHGIKPTRWLIKFNLTVSNAKFEVDKFDGMNNFGMWQGEVMDVLVQQELDITLEDKPKVKQGLGKD